MPSIRPFLNFFFSFSYKYLDRVFLRNMLYNPISFIKLSNPSFRMRFFLQYISSTTHYILLCLKRVSLITGELRPPLPHLSNAERVRVSGITVHKAADEVQQLLSYYNNRWCLMCLPRHRSEYEISHKGFLIDFRSLPTSLNYVNRLRSTKGVRLRR